MEPVDNQQDYEDYLLYIQTVILTNVTAVLQMNLQVISQVIQHHTNNDYKHQHLVSNRCNRQSSLTWTDLILSVVSSLIHRTSHYIKRETNQHTNKL